MSRWTKLCCLCVVAVLLAPGAGALASSLESEPAGLGRVPSTGLTLEKRSRWMADVERVRAAHREGGAADFDRRYPASMWRDLALDVVQKTNLLDRRFAIAVDDAALSRELARICSTTRDPARLREIFAVLENDALLIKEVFVRPVLVQRHFQNAISWDRDIQSAVRNEAAELRSKLTAANFEEITGGRSRRVVFRLLEEVSEASLEDGAIGVSKQEFAELLDTSGEVGGISGPDEMRSGISIGVTVAATDHHVEKRTLWLPKIAPGIWWADRRSTFESELPGNLVASDSLLPAINGAAAKRGGEEPYAKEADVGIGSWERKMPPEGGRGTTSVWTGSEMIVWGGKLQEYHNWGGVFDPVTDTWKPVSSEGAPSPRSNHTAVWTGTEMIVWGGTYIPPDDLFPPTTHLSSGGRYDPVSDSWTPTSRENVAYRRTNHTAVWTGAEMIVWGGDSDILPLSKCGRYDPSTDMWTHSASGAPITGNVRHHSAVWTGDEMIVWGGYVPSPGSYSDRGAAYDPSLDSWSLISSSGLTGRKSHSAVWTGEEMVVWGGEYYDDGWFVEGDGARLDPAENRWSPVSGESAPAGRSRHSAVWTGSGMIVWGGDGSSSGDYVNTGAVYDPEADSWAGMTTGGAPSPRMEHPAVWTGTEMIVWGGYPTTSSGGRYDPALDLWAPTAAGDVSDRQNHTAVWTGNEMIVWGGRRYSGVSVYFDSGGIYDPVLDAWRHLPLADAPTPREEHTAVWGDGVMVVWGGVEGSFISNPYLSTGGAYDPVADGWAATSVDNVPDARIYHCSVWTGDGMLVWGGWAGYGIRTDTGAIYDPSADTWVSTTTDSAPAPRYKPTAVWTGSEAIIWGGNTGEAENIGGRYDPATDSWTPVTLTSSPVPRAYHTAVWTGEEMIVWGGTYWPIPVGARYDPAADAWASISEVDAPSSRIWHTAVWTGDHMIIWGGQDEQVSSILNTGFLYDPVSDAWRRTTSRNAPAERAIHTAVWSGSHMLVWGGIWGTSLGIFDPKGVLFEDGFESGDTGAWSSSAP